MSKVEQAHKGLLSGDSDSVKPNYTRLRNLYRGIAVALGLAFGVALLVGVVLWAPQRIVDIGRIGSDPGKPISVVDKLNAENNVRTSLIQAFGAMVLMLGIVFTARQLRINREHVVANWAQQELTREISLATLESTRRAQQAENFSRAVDQLGSESITTRLGGVAALERLALDDVKFRDFVMEILGAFVRSSSPVADCSGYEDADEDADSEGPGKEGSFWGNPARRLSVDVQLALTALGRIQSEDVELEELLHVQDRGLLNFDSSDLSGANLTLGHLQGATFRRANLTEANLSGGSFEGAVFFRIDGARANFIGNFFGAHFSESNLMQCDFQGSDLFMANFEGACLVGASFVKADVRKANFSDAMLSLDGKFPAEFAEAVADSETVWPEGFDPSAAGVIMTKGEAK